MIEQADPNERRRSRTVHRIGVAACLLMLAAAMAGLLGKGPLSKVTIRAENGSVAVEYYRFVRYEGPVEMKVTVPPRVTADGFIELALSRSFVQNAELTRINPKPSSETAGANYITYSIRAETNAATAVTVQFSPHHFGRLQFQVRVDDSPPLKLSHFAYP